MKLRTVVIATLLHYAVYFREGDNEYPPFTLAAGQHATAEELVDYAARVTALGSAGVLALPPGVNLELVEPKAKPPGAWLVFERMILLRHQGLPNQGRTPPLKHTMTQTPKPPKGWVAMTMPGFLRALA